ncbi:MAG: rod shape-determining protein MreC [Halanaerobium sp.]
MFNLDRNTLIIITIVLLFILAFIFLYLTDINIAIFDWLGDLIYNFLTPIFNISNNIYNVIYDFFHTLFSINEIKQEITELREQNLILERQVMYLQYIDKENTRLRELLDFKEKVDHEMVGAEVTANSPSVWEKTITINKGKNDGLAERMPVITYNGYLVGRIDYAGRNSSQVRLINDKQFVVGGIISRSDSREIGLVRGPGRRDKHSVMDNIAWNADIESGDVVYTSGLSNNFPSGIKIGEVQSVDADNYGLSQKAEVMLFINTVTIEEVMVITNFKNTETAE